MERADPRIGRLGPGSRAPFAGRRRWMRGLAIALACLTAASALVQVRRSAPRASLVPVVVARRTLHTGEPVRPRDLALATPEATPPVPGSFTRIDAASGRVAAHPIAAGEAVTAENTVPVLRYYGVAARVPRGMRALNLVVPSSSMFGGELAPLSRVDLLGAFDLGQERAASALLATGVVLRASPAHGAAAARPGVAGAGDFDGRGSLVELEVAVPQDREREVALAQAFGRILVAVHPLAREAVHPAPSGSLTVRRYLGLPPVAPPVPAVAPPAWPPVLRPPAADRGGGARAAPPSRSGSAALVPRPARRPAWAVEVIAGAERSVQEVPRLSGTPAPGDEPAEPNRGVR